MTSDLAYPAQKEFSFLQTVVNEELGHRHERKDSNKHNGTGLNISSLRMSTFTLPDRPRNTRMEHKDEKLMGFSRKDENSNKIWEDFLTDEEIERKKGSKEAKREVTDETKCANSGQSEKLSEAVTAMSHTGGRDTDGRHDGIAGELVANKKKKKHIPKQAAPTAHPPAPPATSGSQPNLSHHGNRARDSNRHDTKSETDGRPGRRLGRRQRVSPVRRADPVTSEQILHQRIQELHTLMVTPLMEPVQYLHQTRQELLRLQGFSQQRAAQLMESLSQHQPGRRVQQQYAGEWNSTTSDDGYSVLRSAQLHRTTPQRPWTSGPVRALADSGERHKRRPYSAEHAAGSTHEGIAGVTESAAGVSVQGPIGNGRGSKLRGQQEDAGDNSPGTMNVTKGRKMQAASPHTEKRQSPNRSDGTSKSHSASPTREIEHLDTHLKHTHNPALRKWLKQKNKELRKQKAEERKRLREERAKKQDDVRARQEMFKDSEKKVKEWTLQKKKDARKRAEEKRREMQENNKCRADREHQGDVQGNLRTRSLENLSAHASAGNRLLVPGIRPSTGQGEVSQDSCEPSVSTFVYKRPVSGHVRLIKLQQQRKEHAKKSEEDKILQEQKLAEAKSKKMRMSYDQWLVKKREEDYTKRQDLAKQKALAKSDPELERILPELARRRIDNIQRGKKRVDTGITILDNDVKTRLAGDNSHTETPENTRSGTTRDTIDVSGQKQVLKQRPATAKSSLHPQKSTSPRRPRSANLQPGGPLDASSGEVSPPKLFKLPFPPLDGAPKYVIATQKKLFSPHLTSSLPQYPEAQQEEPHVALDSPLDSDTTPHQMALQTDEGTSIGNKHHTDLDAGKRQVEDELHEAENSFFVTHGNLGHARDGEEQFSHAELGQKVAQVLEGDHEKQFINELNISCQENVEHSTNHTNLQESDVSAAEDNDKINNTEDDTCESDVTTDSASTGTSDGAALEVHQKNTQDESIEHQAYIPEVIEKMAVLEESAPKDNLELSGHGVAGKHVSFLATDVVHEVSDVSEASDEVTDDGTGEDQYPTTEAIDACEDKDHEGKDDEVKDDCTGEHQYSTTEAIDACEVKDDEVKNNEDKDDEVKDDGTREHQYSITEAIDACEDKEQLKASLHNKLDDDDDDIVMERKNSKQALQEDRDASNSSPTSDLFPDEEGVHQSLHAPGSPDTTIDAIDREI